MAASSEPSPRKPTVVGIGASAGGLAALRTFFEQVPADSGLSFVVVVHLSPEHESHLADLLQVQAKIPVTQVRETVHIDRNHAYVIPPAANLSAIDTHLRLSKLEERRVARAPIDHFFRTLAATHDGDAIAIILSGTGSDGTLGVKDIKAKGGLVIVQDPNEADYDGMPQSAIATGLADFILPIAEIPAAILRYDRTAPRVVVPSDGEEVSGDERATLQKIFAQLRARTDRDFSRYKRSTVLRRIARRMQLNSIEDMGGYLERLRETPEEVRALADDLLITVTHFFRDPEVFEKLQKDVVPRLFANKGPHDSVRAWSVGCATGEEAYSLAILLMEEAAKHEFPPQIQVFASDLHGRSLDRAREGFYAGDIEADVGAERLKRFFHKEDSGYRIRKELRDIVVFAPHNVLADPPFSRLDLISCRNLLIYLEREMQAEVIELFHYALVPDGTLVLGSAETVDATELFRVEDKKLCVFRKRNVPPREPRLPVFPISAGRIRTETGLHPARPQEAMAYGRMHQLLVERVAPPSLLVAPDNRVVHLSEHVGRYLIHPGGEPTANVIKLVREELRIELQAALQSARESSKVTDTKPVPVQFNGHPKPVVMHVRPALEPEQDGFALVIFEEREPREPEPEVYTAPTADTTERIAAIEKELSLARQRLQSVIEEYETSQEEMKASSEEMQSTNEELRSTMEELETSKEELQSMNEELQTVNQQNRHKVEELAQLSGDLQNLLAATDIAVLFLDRDLRILRFTPKLGELFNIRTTDRGRPISDLTHRLGYGELITDAESVLARLVPVEREVKDDAGRWYLTRVLPYRSTDDRIEGVVITFIDIATRKKAEEALRQSDEHLRRMFNVDLLGVLLLNKEGYLTEANESFRLMTGYTTDEIAAGRLHWRALTPPEFIPVSEEQMVQLQASGKIGPYEKEYLCKDGSRKWLMFSGSDLEDGRILEYCIDISDVKKAEQEAKEADHNLHLANEALLQANIDLKHFSYAVSHDMQEPLRMVISYTQLLQHRYKEKLDAQAGEYIGHAVEGARRMEALLKDLREYWSVNEPHHHEELQPIDTCAVLEHALKYLQTAVEESGATVEHGELPEVSAERYPLTLLFQNLVGNAIKYRRPDVKPRVVVQAERQGGHWAFAVSDNGIGIPQEFLEVIFDPFQRLQADSTPGTGLGLAMCRKVVERYKGKIWAESTPGQGTTLRFTLPAVAAQA